MKSILSLIIFIWIVQDCCTKSVMWNIFPMGKRSQTTTIYHSQDTFPVVQSKRIESSLMPSISLTGKSHLKDKYNRFKNPIYTFLNDSIIGSISANFIARSMVYGFQGQRFLSEEGFEAMEEEWITMVKEGLSKTLLPYCNHFSKRPGMPLTGTEIFILWITLQPQGASEEVMVANNPFRIPPLQLQHKSYREPFALNRGQGRILQFENLYIGLMGLEKFLQEQDQDVGPIERLVGTIISPKEYETYLKNLKIFTRKSRIPKRPEIKLVASKKQRRLLDINNKPLKNPY